MGKAIEDAFLVNDTVYIILQNMGFLVHIEKSLMEPKYVMEFLAFIINTWPYTNQRRKELISHCKKVLSMEKRHWRNERA